MRDVPGSGADGLRISDARMRGTPYGAVVLHVAPGSLDFLRGTSDVVTEHVTYL